MIIGIDEAGRGPLAGPVWVGAAVILDESIDLSLFRDSKVMTERQRESAYELIQQYAHEGQLLISSSRSSAKTIDTIGIIRAQAQAMKRCVERLMAQIDQIGQRDEMDGSILSTSSIASISSPLSLLIDGNHTFGLEKGRNVATIIKGDQKIPAISIASIVAKVERDHYMIRQSKKFPEYSFEKHKGYGTQQHRDAIREHGMCALHRESFCGKISQ